MVMMHELASIMAIAVAITVAAEKIDASIIFVPLLLCIWVFNQKL